MAFLLPLLLVGLLYFVVMQPQRRRAQAQQRMTSDLTPGDEVVTAGGIIGTLVVAQGDRALVEVAPGVEMEFLVQSIVRRTPGGAAEPPADGQAIGSTGEEPDGPTDASDIPFDASSDAPTDPDTHDPEHHEET